MNIFNNNTNNQNRTAAGFAVNNQNVNVGFSNQQAPAKTGIFEHIRINKKYVIGEGKNSVLFRLEGNEGTGNNAFNVWINKRQITASPYSNFLDISIMINAQKMMYNLYVYINTEWDKPDSVLNPEQFAQLLKMRDYSI